MQKETKVKEMSARQEQVSTNGMQTDGEAEALAVESQFDRATERLRALVLRGAFPLDVKLPETRAAELIGVSRTPARLAMAALERDGLLVRLPRRGFRVRSFSLDEVVEAILVRGELEGVAVRATAERGLAKSYRERMEAAIARAEGLLKASTFDAAARLSWCDINEAFHATLVEASGLRPLASAYAQVNLVPLASPRATIFNVAEPALLHRQLTAAHEDHGRILAALIDRQSTRAAALVREHAYRSGENKRRNFPHIDMQAMVIETPGIALVRMPGAEAAAVQTPR
jgi:GntR family transcriptional regulator of vanillate catabolism